MFVREAGAKLFIDPSDMFEPVREYDKILKSFLFYVLDHKYQLFVSFLVVDDESSVYLRRGGR